MSLRWWSWRAWSSSPWPTLDLADGSTIPAMGIQASDGDRARFAVAELTALVHERGEATDV